MYIVRKKHVSRKQQLYCREYILLLPTLIWIFLLYINIVFIISLLYDRKSIRMEWANVLIFKIKRIKKDDA